MYSFKLKRLLVCSVGKIGLICSSLTKKEKKKKNACSGNGGIRSQYIKNEKECLNTQTLTSGCNVVRFSWFCSLCSKSRLMSCVSRLFSRPCFTEGREYVSGFAATRFLLALEIYLLYKINRGLVKYC